MKKIIFSIALVLCCGGALVSCDSNAKFEEDIPENPVMRPITSFKAMDKEEIFEGVIDDNLHTIKLEVEAWTNLKEMVVNLGIPERAKLISPEKAEGVWDLTKPCEIVVNNLVKDIKYTLTVTRKADFIEDPLVSVIAKAGDETATGEINHTERTVALNFGPWVDLSKTTVTIGIKDHVTLINPKTAETECNFAESNELAIVINDIQKDVTYKLIVTQSELVPQAVDPKTLKTYRLDNDANNVDSSLGLGTSDYGKLFDGKFMASANDYDAVGWSPFACQPNGDPNGEAFITIDAGKMMYLAKFSAHRYWNEANTQVTKFEIYGFCQEGVPAKNGSWDGWTLLGSYSYTPETGNFAEGDCIIVPKDQAKQAQYYRLRIKENWFVHSGHSDDWRAHVYSFTELRFWEYK